MANSNNSTSGSNYLDCKDSDEVFQMFCEICHQNGVKNVPADGFCVNCLQYFCGNCLRFHKIFLPEHQHLDQYEMPQDFCSEFCEEHKEDLVSFYCKSCDTFICRTCKTTMHTNCKVLFLPEEVDDFENTRDYKVFEKMVADLETELKKIKLSLDEDNKNINSIHQQAVKAIESQREEMLTKFDQMKKDLEETFQKTLNNDRNRLEDLNKKFNTLSKNYTETKRQINTLQESGQRCKLYMTMKQSTSILNSLTDDIEHMKGREPITQYQYKADQLVMGFIQACKFGYTVISQTNESEKQTGQLVETATVKPKQAKHRPSSSKETNSKEFKLESIQDKVTATENQPERSENAKDMQASIGTNPRKILFKEWLPTKSNTESKESCITQELTKDNPSRLRLLTNIPKKHRRKAEKQAVKEERERKYEEKKKRKEEENRRKEEENSRKVEKMIQNLNKDPNIVIYIFIITIASLSGFFLYIVNKFGNY